MEELLYTTVEEEKREHLLITSGVPSFRLGTFTSVSFNFRESVKFIIPILQMSKTETQAEKIMQRK